MCIKKKENENVEHKLSFSKISVILMYVMVIGFFAFIAITQQYPPVEFIVAWMGFWTVQAVVTAVLEINKRGNKNTITLLEALLPYINEENASALLERYIGITPKYKKAKVIKEMEEDVKRDGE